MKLDNFRKLLLKKSENSDIENIVYFVHDDIIADMVMESLEKMARAKHKGDAANLAMRDFGVEMDPEHEPSMIHDALSHHASQYKSALHSGRHDLANQHARQIFRIMDMADQAQKHSHGKLDVQAVSPHAWERNAKTKQFTEEDRPVQAGRKKPGQFVTDTKGWRYRGRDYSFLQQAPHESYRGEVRRHGHNEGYPLEHIRINGRHLDIQDVPPEDLKGYKEHPFDKHPVMDHFEIPASQRSPQDDQKWLEDKEKYADSPELDQYFSKLEDSEQRDPEKFKSRGSKPSDPVHKPVDNPLDLSDTATSTPKQASKPTQEVEAKPDISSEDKIKHIMEADIPEDIKRSIVEALQSGKK